MPPARQRLPSWAHPIAALCATLALMAVSLWSKSACVAPVKDVNGISIVDRGTALLHACITDVQGFWAARELYLHLLPYVNGSYTAPNIIGGGVIEYPILSGLLIWLTALPVSDDGAFLALTWLVLLPFALMSTLLLVSLAPTRAWLWYTSPALIMFGVYNWDLPAVSTVVAAVYVLARRPWRYRTSLLVVGALLGLGGALKLYPLMFLLPLALYTLFGSDQPRRPDPRTVCDLVALLGGAVAVTAIVNIPFLIADPHGWLIPYLFQAARPIDGSTLSIWFYGVALVTDPGGPLAQLLMARSSTLATFVGIVAAAGAGLLRVRRGRAYPWLQVSASMLCLYMVLNKVNSPQYLLWLLPFFVVLGVRLWLVVLYVAVNVVLFVVFFQNAYLGLAGVELGWTNIVLDASIWARAILLVVLAVVFLRSESAERVRPAAQRRQPLIARAPAG